MGNAYIPSTIGICVGLYGYISGITTYDGSIEANPSSNNLGKNLFPDAVGLNITISNDICICCMCAQQHV